MFRSLFTVLFSLFTQSCPCANDGTLKFFIKKFQFFFYSRIKIACIFIGRIGFEWSALHCSIYLAICNMVTSPLLHHLLWFRSDAHEILFSHGYCNFKPNQDGNSNSKGNSKNRGSVWWVQTKRTLVSTVCDKWCNECWFWIFLILTSGQNWLKHKPWLVFGRLGFSYVK